MHTICPLKVYKDLSHVFLAQDERWQVDFIVSKKKMPHRDLLFKHGTVAKNTLI